MFCDVNHQVRIMRYVRNVYVTFVLLTRIPKDTHIPIKLGAVGFRPPTPEFLITRAKLALARVAVTPPP